MRHRVSTGYDVELVPVLDAYVASQFVAIPESRKQPGFFAFLCPHDLAAPGDDAATRGLLVILSCEVVSSVEIELCSEHVPFCLAGEGWRGTAWRSAWARPLRASSSANAASRPVRVGNRAPVLHAAIDCCSFTFHLEL